MSEDIRSSAPRIFMLIASPKQAKKASMLLQKGAIPLQYRMSARGTATAEVLDLLGLGDPEKTVLVSMLPKALADRFLQKIHEELRMDTANSGVAFTLPISGGNNQLLNRINQIQTGIQASHSKEDMTTMAESKYSLIAVVANQGCSEDVMAAARAAGATGGTVLHSRRIMNEEAMTFWGFSLQQEKETILIVTTEEKKLPIMQAINSKCGVHSDVQGIVLSIPVDNIIGLNLQNTK